MEEAPGPPLSHRATGSLLGVLPQNRAPQQLSRDRDRGGDRGERQERVGRGPALRGAEPVVIVHLPLRVIHLEVACPRRAARLSALNEDPPADPQGSGRVVRPAGGSDAPEYWSVAGAPGA